jgi:luciferase family oxidoreductase group 1
VELSILDQSPVSADMSASDALKNTLALAKRADELGYRRYWVSEHHNDVAFAHAAPEILICRLAAATERIRIGSGGVLLSHYSPYKVAEQFNLLESLFPGRIDLGIGRAGGGEGESGQALRPWGEVGPSYWDKVGQLLAWMGRGRPAERPYPRVHARPLAESEPHYWILGTSPASARYAAQRGLSYAFGGFLDPRSMVESLAAYHQHFAPSRYLERPYTNLTWFVLAAETEVEAKALARSAEVWFVRTFVRGGVSAFPSDAEARAERLSPQEEMMVALRREFTLIGTGTQVVEGLHRLKSRLQCDELSLVTLTAEPAARLRSYELIAAAR